MSSPTQDSLYEMFLAISGTNTPEQVGAMPMPENGSEITGTTSVVADATSQVLAGLAAKSPTQSAADDATGVTSSGQMQTTENAATTSVASSSTSANQSSLASATSLITSLLGGIPLVSTTAQAATSGGSAGSTIGSIASDVLKSGLGILPLIGGLIGLFGGGDSATPTTLEKYAMPQALTFQGAESANGIGMGDYDQNGMPRAYQPNAGTGSAAQTSSSSNSNGASSPDGTSSTPQITVNVQAMDARSFLDRSSDIAAAVREAMLNLNSINDVVNDL